MNKFILATALVAISTTAFAETKNVSIRDVYKTEYVKVPEIKKICSIDKVPIYETYEKKGSAAEAITGGVIGGAIGNQFGSGTGKDVMTILGVIVGANAADKKETRIVGYRNERSCEEDVFYFEKEVKSYSHSIMTFYENGKRYEVEFQK